ncbi:MAG: hypothetical protein KY442_02690 [Proteobacteria bacterium]|nr:hypothetical protein [Pseudomonadota bacterium]
MKPIRLAIAVALAVSAIACDVSPPNGDDAAATNGAHAIDRAHLDRVDASPAGPAMSAAAPKLQADLRALWNGHVDATRDYALAVKADDSAAADRAAQDVVANAKAIAEAVAGFYGEPAGYTMLALLGGHWGGVKALTDSHRSGDATAAAQALDALVANADEIAVFLAGANPHLAADAVRGLLVAHGGHHAMQAQQIMTGDTAAEARTWIAMQAHMDVIADALAGAIARQFPDQAR